ncbi:MAG: hypothetical protein ACHQ01_04670 [Candidatus Limnocylindrales bacterium]
MLCVFCGSTAAPTKEHVYAKWIREGLWATGPTVITRAKLGEQRRNTTTGLTWILRRSVCCVCNSGWMSTYLEKPVKDWLLPPMRGQRIEFMPETQRLVAAWAVKTALMFELKAKEDGRQVAVAPESNLTWLYDHRTDPVPPPGSQVWIAAVDAGLGTAGAQPGWHMVTTSMSPNDMEFYFVTFAVGNLVFQVAGQDFRQPDHLTRTGQSLAILQRPDWLISYLTAIWPERSDLVRWPLSTQLKRSELSAFASGKGTIAARWRIASIPRLG